MMKQPAYITLSESTAKMMKMAAARKSMTASAYVAQLVVRDCEKSGIAALVTTGDTDATDDDSNQGLVRRCRHLLNVIRDDLEVDEEGRLREASEISGSVRQNAIGLSSGFGYWICRFVGGVAHVGRPAHDWALVAMNRHEYTAR